MQIARSAKPKQKEKISALLFETRLRGKKREVIKGENGKQRKRNRTCGRRQHKNSGLVCAKQESAHVNHVVGGSAARSLCTKQTNYRTPLPTAAPLARVALLLSGRRRPPCAASLPH